MADLVATMPAEGLLPVTVGGTTLSGMPARPVMWIAPFRGQVQTVAAALAAEGLDWPEPNRFTGSEDRRAVWVAAGEALILGASPAPKGAAAVDQSDAWTWLRLDGETSRAVLARLTPLDLRPGHFAVGDAARTLLFHMTATLMRTGEDRYEIMVFRSMAATAVHDLERAMQGVAARDMLSS